MPNLHEFKFKEKMLPKIEKAELERRLKFISPCILQEREVLKLNSFGDPINRSYSWEADKDDCTLVGTLTQSGIAVKDRPAEFGTDSWYMKSVASRIGEFITLHNFGYYGLYKPSIEEVLAQLPEELFDEVKLAGRQLYFTNKMISDDINVALLNQEFHIAKTNVYITLK